MLVRLFAMVMAFGVSGCAGIGPYDGIVMQWSASLFVMVAIFFAFLSFSIEEKNGGNRWDNYCGISFFVALAFYLVG